MKLWVTGGSGFVGRAVLRALAARGDDVTVLVRPTSVDRLDASSSSMRVVPVILPAGESALAKLPRPDAIFHLAGIVARGRVVSLDEYRAVHVVATEQLAQHACRYDARLVFLSSISVVGCRDRPFVADESTPCVPGNRYGATKLEGERVLARVGADHVVLRPPGIWGVDSPGDPVLRVARMVTRGTPLLPDEPPLSVVHVDNLVAAILGVGLDRGVRGTFFIDDGRPIEERALARTLGAALDRAPVLGERGLARSVARVGRRRVLEVLRSTSHVLRPLARVLPPPLVFPALDTRRIQAAGHRSVIDLDDAMRTMVHWARATGRL